MVCVDPRVIVQCAEKENLLPEVVEIINQFCALNVMRDFQIQSLAMCTNGCTHKAGRPIKMLQIAENYTPNL